VFEQESPSGKTPVVDLSSSSDEKGLIPDTSRNEEFARMLFSDLNRDVVRLPGDSKVIILSDSNMEEEEVREEEATGAEAMPTSAAEIPALTASATNIDEAPKGCKMIIVVVALLIRKLMVAAMAEMKPVCLGLPHQGGA
jgi:hypothetical protein